MTRRPPDRVRMLGRVLLALFLGAAGLVLRQPGWRPADALLQESYDSLHALSGADPSVMTHAPVVIVYLDLHSYLSAKQDPSKPWPRELHALLLRRLTAEGARGVVFDVVFGVPGDDAGADAALERAIRENGRVLLAGQANDDSGQYTDPALPWTRLLRVEAPQAELAAAAEGWGLANHVLDEDFVVRRHFEGSGSPPRRSLSWAAAQGMGWAAGLGGDPGVKTEGGRWIRYYGPPMSLPHVSYVQALDVEGLPRGFFRDRVVWVGARPMAELFRGRQDEFRSPFHSWDNRELFHPGVEVHATAFLNLVRGDWLERWPAGVEMALLGLVAVAAGAGLSGLRPWPATGVAAAGMGLVLGLALVGFRAGVWFPWLVVAGVQLPGGLVGAWLLHFREWQLTRRAMEGARRVAEAKIREQAELIDKANDAILLEDLCGRVLLANPAAERLYGWTAAEFQSGAVTGIECMPSRRAEARATAMACGEWRGDLEQLDRMGRRLTVESRLTLIRDAGGAPRSLLVIQSDVTDRRQLEREALRLQRTEAIGALASGMAHDLNNALAPVLMGVQLLRREGPGGEARRVLDLMEGSTLRGAEMVRQVVLFARGRSGGREAVDLRGLVRELERLARDTFPTSIGVRAHVPPDLWRVEGNATELHQVLLNLCVNARDAMLGGGRIDLVADNVPGVAGDGDSGEGDRVSLLVSDTGMGIPAEVLPRIFEPFFTTKPEGQGTGLGLSTTARIVKAHGGTIRVDSRPGEGTSFEVLLPRRVAQPVFEELPLTLGEGPRGNGERVLVVDDDRAVRELIQRTLEDHGYRVMIAADGEDALARFRECAGDLALVLCDRGLPGMDGARVRDQLRSFAPDLPWVHMSGQGAGAGGDADGGEDLSKPFTVAALLGRVRSAVGGQQGPPT